MLRPVDYFTSVIECVACAASRAGEPLNNHVIPVALATPETMGKAVGRAITPDLMPHGVFLFAASENNNTRTRRVLFSNSCCLCRDEVSQCGNGQNGCNPTD